MSRLRNSLGAAGIGDVLHSKTSKYLVESFSGRGAFGFVAKCRNVATKENVAIKMMKDKDDADAEISVLRKLRHLDPEKCNIVRWYGHFSDRGCSCLVFEQLDKSLLDFMVERKFKPLHITEIRPIVKQAASALTYLEALQLLHGDVKMSNIMLVNQDREPLRIKLIDFGIAHDVADIQLGDIFQTLPYRCPEVFLGLPITMAADMWSLGCVAAVLALGALLFHGKRDFDIMMQIIQTVGQPSEKLLSAGVKTTRFFEKSPKGSTSAWKLKTGETVSDLRTHSIRSLDDLLKVDHVIHALSANYLAAMTDTLMFVDMLKQMFSIEGDQRITPQQLLQHPYITMSHITPLSNLSLYSQSCQEVMKSFQTPGNEDGVQWSSQQVTTSFARPVMHNTCALPRPNTAAVTSHVHLQPASRHFDNPRGFDKKSAFVKPVQKIQVVSSSSARVLTTTPKPKARGGKECRPTHLPADPRPKTLGPKPNTSQGEMLPPELTSEDGSGKEMSAKTKKTEAMGPERPRWSRLKHRRKADPYTKDRARKARPTPPPADPAPRSSCLNTNVTQRGAILSEVTSGEDRRKELCVERKREEAMGPDRPKWSRLKRRREADPYTKDRERKARPTPPDEDSDPFSFVCRKKWRRIKSPKYHS